MKKPRQPRAANADPDTILLYSTMAVEALRLARLVSTGLKLLPGDEESLRRKPVAVQEAILAQRRSDSRYLPPALPQYRAALEAARATGTLPIKPEDWSPTWARFGAHPDRFDYTDPDLQGPCKHPGLMVQILPPANSPGKSEIIAAIAAEAGVAPKRIDGWMIKLLDHFEAADGIKRKPGERRNERGVRVRK